MKEGVEVVKEMFEKWAKKEVEKRIKRGARSVYMKDDEFMMDLFPFSEKEYKLPLEQKYRLYKMDSKLTEAFNKLSSDVSGFVATAGNEKYKIYLVCFEVDGEFIVITKDMNNIFEISDDVCLESHSFKDEVTEKIVKVNRVFKKVISENVTELRIPYLFGEVAFVNGIGMRRVLFDYKNLLWRTGRVEER